MPSTRQKHRSAAPAQPLAVANPARTRSRDRRGMAVLLMLLLLSLTLGLSYALVRSQNMSSRIERNLHRRDAARDAAVTGILMAWKKMQTSSWAGVGTTLTGKINAWDGYTVTYTAGDATLTSSSSDYADYPFRVTLLSTGTAVDPAETTAISTQQVQAVVRLVPRALSTEPAEWSQTSGLTAYQYKAGTFSVPVPFALQGPARVAGPLTLARDSSWTDTVRQAYLTDLNTMRASGSYPDCRPISNSINLPTASQEAGLVSTILGGALGVTVNNTSVINTSALSFTSSVNSYKLYRGGPSYAVETNWMSTDQNFGPDPLTNPLGIMVTIGTTYINSNTTFRGTLLTRSNWFFGTGSIMVSGQNIQFTPVDLPPLDGTTTPVRLPTAVTINDFRVQPASSATFKGLIVAADEFEIQGDGQNDMQVTFQGTVVANDFLLRTRSDWNQPPSWWANRWTEFQTQKPTGVQFFPVWLQAKHGLKYGPQLKILPDATPARYTWNNLQNPLYAPGPNDNGGLRWDLLGMKDVE